MFRKAVPPAPPASARMAVKIPHESIARRAYEKWCQRGRPHGTAVQDWMEAEAELRAEFASSASPKPRR